MPKYIDAEKLKREVLDNSLWLPVKTMCEIINAQSEVIATEINQETAIGYLTKTGWLPEHDRVLTEHAEVKHGKWYIPRERSRRTYIRICTNCQDVAYYCGTGDYKFCPNCGAIMGVSDE